MKKLSNISGAKKLSKKEQKSINGGTRRIIFGCGQNGCEWPLVCCNGKYCVMPGNCEME